MIVHLNESPRSQISNVIFSKKYFADKPYLNHITQYFRYRIRNQREKYAELWGLDRKSVFWAESTFLNIT